MEILKKILGIVWIALSLVVAYFCIMEFGIPKLSSGSQDDLVFGIIILFILTPIIVLGMALFGFYALVGEYSEEKL